jgi:hypothetical protein
MLTKLSFNSGRVLLFVALVAGIVGHCDGEFDKVAENNIFLKYLYQKYGSDHNVLTFEGLEHLLENLNLGEYRKLSLMIFNEICIGTGSLN